MTEQLPHTTYLEAVADAFSRANMEPTSWEPLADEQLEGVFQFGADHPAVETYSSWPSGVMLTWDRSGWLLVDLADRSGLEVRADQYADPDRLVAIVRPALVEGTPLPRDWDSSRWEHAGVAEAAVDAWHGEAS